MSRTFVLPAVATALAVGCLARPVVQQSPSTSDVFVDEIVQSRVDKIDLLFMIDNSASMADKQEILKAAVPQMLNRLITPLCVDDNGAPIPGLAADRITGTCATGSPEFPPIKDIHIAIVTSSLGSHGGDVCNGAAHGDDHGQALGSVRAGLKSWNGTGFLAWDPGQDRNQAAGVEVDPSNIDSDPNTLIEDFKSMVSQTGEDGCGYEASLESWYRFLIDPEPPLSVGQVTATDGQVQSQKMGINAQVLAQRSAFLRPDSLVAIVMLSDENDCSIADSGYGWFLATHRNSQTGAGYLHPSTSVCDQDPNDPCCMSCQESVPPQGCAPPAQDSKCANDAPLADIDDSANLRCWDNKRRFGFDMLYPTTRYSDALKSPTICPDSQIATGCPAPVTNPLFDVNINGPRDDITPRDKDLVYIAGIIGVPWQDLASKATLSDPAHLSYLSAPELKTSGRWDVILGDASKNQLPSDPFMVETYVDRTTLKIPQANPVLPTAALVSAASTDPQANPINGHEQNIVGHDDLQYACIFPLATPKLCTSSEDCDCAPDATTSIATTNSPLCNPPDGGAPTTTQHYAKAYPGLRFLQVLHDFGDHAIPASICPKLSDDADAGDTTNPDYGYNPAVASILDAMKTGLQGRCLPRPLDAQVIDAKNPALGTSVPCVVLEARPKHGVACPACDPAQGRTEANPAVIPDAIDQMKQRGQCDLGAQACSDFCFCNILEETGAAADACKQDPTVAGTMTGVPPGYCYISNADVGKACARDADCESGSCAANVCVKSKALTNCHPDQQQLLGFVSTADVPTPAKGAYGFIACIGASVTGGSN
jgi:hypothetical protein